MPRRPCHWRHPACRVWRRLSRPAGRRSCRLSRGALAALVPAVSASVFLALPSATVALTGAVPGIALDAAVAVASQAATITCRAPLALADKVVRAGAGAMALSARGPIRAGPRWRAINENQAVWADREPTISAWTPVPAA